MRLWAGSSGFSYKEWKGAFYPEKHKNGDMLSYYAERLPTVEINNTFYRMPRTSMLEGWRGQVPEDFQFVLKASRRITHQAKLKDAQDSVDYLFQKAEALQKQLGPVLFQCPPYLKYDQVLLDDFLAGLPAGRRVAMEFRSSSWRNDGALSVLADRNIAFCVADHDDDRAVVCEWTADWGYLRLRKPSYAPGELSSWLARFREAGLVDVFVFFKHEEDGAAPKMAQQMMALADTGRPALKPPTKARPPIKAPKKREPDAEAGKEAGEG